MIDETDDIRRARRFADWLDTPEGGNHEDVDPEQLDLFSELPEPTPIVETRRTPDGDTNGLESIGSVLRRWIADLQRAQAAA